MSSCLKTGDSNFCLFCCLFSGIGWIDEITDCFGFTVAGILSWLSLEFFLNYWLYFCNSLAFGDVYISGVLSRIYAIWAGLFAWPRGCIPFFLALVWNCICIDMDMSSVMVSVSVSGSAPFLPCKRYSSLSFCILSGWWPAKCQVPLQSSRWAFWLVEEVVLFELQ